MKVFITLFALISLPTVSFAAETCGFPPTRANPSNDYSIKDVVRDQKLFDECLKNKNALFMVASFKGVECVTALKNGSHALYSLGEKVPAASDDFTFYPITAGKDVLILSESADCKSGKTFSATQGGQYGKPVCQNFTSGQLKQLYFQYGKENVDECRNNRELALIKKESTSDKKKKPETEKTKSETSPNVDHKEKRKAPTTQSRDAH